MYYRNQLYFHPFAKYWLVLYFKIPLMYKQAAHSVNFAILKLSVVYNTK